MKSKLESSFKDEQSLVRELRQENHKIRNMIKQITGERKAKKTKTSTMNKGTSELWFDLTNEENVTADQLPKLELASNITAKNSIGDNIEQESTYEAQNLTNEVSIGSRKQKANNEFECKICVEIIKSLHDFTDHMKNVHQPQHELFKCPICCRSCTYRALYQHVKNFRINKSIANAVTKHKNFTAEQHLLLRNTMVEIRRQCNRIRGVNEKPIAIKINKKLKDMVKAMRPCATDNSDSD